MNRIIRLIFISILALSSLAMAQTASAADHAPGWIKIIAPANGAALPSGNGNKLTYNVQLSPTGNHLHVYVDDQSPIIDRNVNSCPCSLDLPDLASGQHTVTVKEATSSHALTGIESSVTFSVK